MRLNQHYRDTIKKYFEKYFISGKIYLFGSRIDDTKKGGDIDLYFVLSDFDNLFEKKMKFLSRVKRELGEQKIDIIFNSDESRLIEKEARKWGIEL